MKLNGLQTVLTKLEAWRLCQDEKGSASFTEACQDVKQTNPMRFAILQVSVRMEEWRRLKECHAPINLYVKSSQQTSWTKPTQKMFNVLPYQTNIIGFDLPHHKRCCTFTVSQCYDDVNKRFFCLINQAWEATDTARINTRKDNKTDLPRCVVAFCLLASTKQRRVCIWAVVVTKQASGTWQETDK